MAVTEHTCNPGSATQWYELGLFYRKNGQFGEAVNAFRNASDAAEKEFSEGSITLETCRDIQCRADASVELIGRITGFVNKDLMNP